MKTVVQRLGIVLAVLMAAGCTTGKPRPARVVPLQALAPPAGALMLEPAPRVSRAVNSKNYELGRKQSAAVGAPLIDVRDYTATERVVSAVLLRSFEQRCARRTAAAAREPVGGRPGLRRPRAKSNPAKRASAAAGEETKTLPGPLPGEGAVQGVACTSGPLKHLRGAAGDRHDVVGILRDAAVSPYAVRFDAPDGTLYLLVDADGRLISKRYVAWHAASQNKTPALEPIEPRVPLAIESPLVRFETRQEAVASTRGSRFEIVYQGLTNDHRGGVYHLLYREFGRSMPTVPIHVQSLEFVGTPQTIDTVGLRIRVHEARPDEIVYTVLSD